MIIPTYFKYHRTYLLMALPWVFIVMALKIAGYLAWPWWAVCFSAFAGPVVYCCLVIRSDLKECEADLEVIIELGKIIELEEVREMMQSTLQELLLMVLRTNFPD